MRGRFIKAMVILALPAAAPADTLVATRTIRAMSPIGPEDVAVADREVPGGLRTPDAAVGMEARVVLYAGRPIRSGDVGPPALIERNQIVALSYRRGALVIQAQGRALARAGAGDTIRVMNTDSRNTVTGTVTAAGTIRVAGRRVR